MAIGPGDELDAAGRGDLRAAHTDREQAVCVLRAAFIEGRLDHGELDLRLGRAFASRTYAELAALTADLPAGLPAVPPPVPALVPWFGLLVMGASAVEAGLWAFVFAAPNSYADNGAVFSLVCSVTFTYVVILLIAGLDKLGSWRRQRPPGQRPPRSAPGVGGQASRRPPSADPGRQLPPGGDGHWRTAEAAPIVCARLQPS